MVLLCGSCEVVLLCGSCEVVLLCGSCEVVLLCGSCKVVLLCGSCEVVLLCGSCEVVLLCGSTAHDNYCRELQKLSHETMHLIPFFVGFHFGIFKRSEVDECVLHDQ